MNESGGVDSQTANSHSSQRLPDSRSKSVLCSTCRKVDIRHAFYHQSERKHMGRWADILRSENCPLCRLMVESLKRCTEHALPRDEDEIILENAPAWELGIEKSPYDSTKSDSYSNKFDLRSKAKRCNYTAFRIIVGVRRRPKVYGVLQRIRSENSGSEKDFFGRKVSSKRVNFSLIRHWIRECERWHGSSCGSDGLAGGSLPERLRLINVLHRRIITVSIPTRRFDTKYLTLSYVWGVEAMKNETGMAPATLTRDMVQINEMGEEDTPMPNSLPRTIEDAIYLTKALGYEYLWVDAFCIVQDDPIELKDRTLRWMDAIYNRSTVTIVAASGHHADAGIPGVGEIRKTSAYLDSVEGLQISTMSPSFSELENSRSLPWNTRGWTFQEKILAKRLLLFTDFQIYFKCAESIWIEEAYMETDEPSKSMEARPEKYRWGPDRPQSEKFMPTDKTMLMRLVLPQLNIDDPWGYLGKFPDYAAALREYTRRSLSDPNDKLKAIHGVFRTLRSDTGNFIQGHPENYFLQSLLWHPEACSHISRSDLNFPSWSWVGWQTGKGIDYDVLDVRVLRGIMLALRAIMKRLAKLRPSVGSGGDGGSEGYSSSNYTSSSTGASGSSYSSSSGASGSSSSAPSMPFYGPLMEWYGGRQWSTLKIAGKASGNIASIFALPLLYRKHTISELYICANGRISGIDCDESLALNTFLEDDVNSKEGSIKVDMPEMESHRRHKLERMSLNSKCPFLSVRSVIIKLYIGRCLGLQEPRHEDESGVFELLDGKGACVGEIWTTSKVARNASQSSMKFLTISWGLSLNYAKVDETYVPRWVLDAARLPESKTFMKMRPLLEKVLAAPSRKTLAGRYGENSEGEVRPKTEYTVMSFLDALFTAKSQEPLPKFLWSTVNVMLIDTDGQFARRLGVGKVIFSAWFIAAIKQDMEDVLLE